MYYVYILESLENGDLYKGSSSDYLQRLEQHNQGRSKYTKNHRPWKLVFLQAYISKADALIHEKKLKRCNREYLTWLISQSANILNKNLDR